MCSSIVLVRCVEPFIKYIAVIPFTVHHVDNMVAAVCIAALLLCAPSSMSGHAISTNTKQSGQNERIERAREQMS